MAHAAVPARSGSTRITPLSGLPLPPEHGRSLDPPPLVCPGGCPPEVGQGALGFATFGGFGLGLGFASGLGFGVAVTGLGVAFGVARGVGAGVARGVGAGVACGVGAAVGAAGGSAVGAGVGGDVTTGDPVEAGTGEPVAGLGEGLGDTDGLASIDGEGVSTDGLALGGGSVVDPPGGDVGPWVSGVVVGPGDGAGLGRGIAAMGPADWAARCCSSTPPMPSAIVARTRFRTPKLRMSRMRCRAVTAIWDSFGPGQVGSGVD